MRNAHTIEFIQVFTHQCHHVQGRLCCREVDDLRSQLQLGTDQAIDTMPGSSPQQAAELQELHNLVQRLQGTLQLDAQHASLIGMQQHASTNHAFMPKDTSSGLSWSVCRLIPRALQL